MKILHLNYSETSGGAAIAAKRLHIALLQYGIDSKMLVCDKKSNETSVFGPVNKLQKFHNIIRPFLDYLPLKLCKTENQDFHSTALLSNRNILKKIENIKPDIVHLHWINNGMIGINQLAKINSPLIWSLHDMWPFSGSEHYTINDRYVTGYKSTNRPVAEKGFDINRLTWNKKKKYYPKIKNLTINGLSKWLANCSSDSLLFKDLNIVNIPNLINEKKFKPLNQKECRKIYNLPQNKKLVCFGADNYSGSPRKGFIQLLDALKKINSLNVDFIVFGRTDYNLEKVLPFKVRFVGQKEDDESLCVLYNAVDVIVIPSLQENLSNIILESLSCGTPVVSFNIGGNSDMIGHKINGYLATPLDVLDLANGIDWVLQNEGEKLSLKARQKVQEHFSQEVVTKKYIKMYEKILLETNSKL